MRKLSRALAIVLIALFVCFIACGVSLLIVRYQASQPAPGIFIDSLFD